MAAPARYTFRVYQGQTWEETITVNNPDTTTPMDLTGYTARMHVRGELADAATLLELDEDNGRLLVSDPSNGELTILVSAADMAELPLFFDIQVWVYDLEIVRASPSPEYVQRVMEGGVVAYPEVTR